MRTQKNKMKTRTKIVVLATAFVVITGGAAFAYWTGGGTGTGAADTGTVEGITINQTAFPADALYPGNTAVPLSGTFTNTNPGPTHVNQVTVAVDPAWTVGTVGPPCTASDFVLVQPTVTNADVITGTAWSGASIRMVNAATNQDNCKNVSPPLFYTSN